MSRSWMTPLAVACFVVSVLSFGIGLGLLIQTHVDLVGNQNAFANIMFSVSFLVYSAVGAFIISRRPNTIGWIFCTMGLAWELRALSIAVTYYVQQAGPAAMPTLAPIASVLNNLWIVSYSLVPILFVLFPDGELRSGRRKLIVAVGLLALAAGLVSSDPSVHIGSQVIELPIPISILGPQAGPKAQDALQTLSGIADLILFIYAAASLTVRVRRSEGVQREQLKWLAMASLLFAVVLIVISIPIFFPAVALYGPEVDNPSDAFAGIPFALSLIAVPIAAAIAILRYRLYDIDILIRRTLIYGALTAVLALVYFGSVIILQQLFRGLTGQGSDIAIIISTLAMAALFTPLRGRVQSTIDRRFYRRKYDAAKVLGVFGETVRNEVDLQRLTDELVGVVQDTMQPDQVTLWLRPTKDGGRRAV